MLLRERLGFYKIWVGKHVGPSDGMSEEARQAVLERRGPGVAPSSSLVMWYGDGEVRVVDSTPEIKFSRSNWLTRIAPIDYVVRLNVTDRTIEVDPGDDQTGWSGWTEDWADRSISRLVGRNEMQFNTFDELLGFMEGVLFARKVSD